MSGTARRLGEVLLGGAIAANLIIVGASFGAYGTRMLRAALPHGPVELAAYSLALALYRQGPHACAPDPTHARGRGAQRRDARARCRPRDLREPVSSARTAFCLLVVVGGLVAAAVLVPRALHSLHPLSFQTFCPASRHATPVV